MLKDHRSFSTELGNSALFRMEFDMYLVTIFLSKTAGENDLVNRKFAFDFTLLDFGFDFSKSPLEVIFETFNGHGLNANSELAYAYYENAGRSLSVGDMVAFHNSEDTDRVAFYRCGPTGWQRMDRHNFGYGNVADDNYRTFDAESLQAFWAEYPANPDNVADLPKANDPWQDQGYCCSACDGTYPPF